MPVSVWNRCDAASRRSDRSGSPQLYVMNADGAEPRRISFGGARYQSKLFNPGFLREKRLPVPHWME